MLFVQCQCWHKQISSIKWVEAYLADPNNKHEKQQKMIKRRSSMLKRMQSNIRPINDCLGANAILGLFGDNNMILQRKNIAETESQKTESARMPSMGACHLSTVWHLTHFPRSNVSSFYLLRWQNAVLIQQLTDELETIAYEEAQRIKMLNVPFWRDEEDSQSTKARHLTVWSTVLRQRLLILFGWARGHSMDHF